MRTSHRKSHSTSALSLLARTSTLAPPSTLKQNISRQHLDRFKQGQSVLPSDNEESNNAGLGISSGLQGMVDDRRRDNYPGDALKKDVAELLDDLKSLRSSSRRRMAALKAVEKFLVEACVGLQFDALEKFLSFNPYEALVSLLTRHTSTLSHRSSHISLPAGDELALSLIPELTLVVGILQGLCLLSRRCKELVGEGWVMEVFIDLLLLLRSQPPSHESDRPISYNILELLFCVLVDSPENARRFEKLSGLEAVVRVLKGSSVVKDVRMKCIEFLYFYLLPEQQESNIDKRNVSISSSSSTTSSELYPPSPPTLSRTKPPISVTTSAVNTSDPPNLDVIADKLGDIDVPFIPQTPVKRPRPNLGYLTPATRQVSGASANTSSSTPGLPTVPASPSSPAILSGTVPPSPREPKEGLTSSAASTGLARMLDEDVLLSSPVPGARIPARLKHRDDNDAGKVGLGIGLPNLDMTGATSKTRGRISNDPSNLTVSSKRSNSGSSGSSTVVPSIASLAISESSTRPSWADLAGGKRSSEARVSAGLGRSASLRREVSPSPSPLARSSFPIAHPSHLEQEGDAEGQVQRQRGGSSGSRMVSRTPRSSTSSRSRHLRAQSHASGLSLRPPIGSSESASVPSIDIPPVPRLPSSIPANVYLDAHPISSSTRMTSMSNVKENKEKEKIRVARPKGFPTKLTKGMVPSASSPGLSAMAAASFNLSSSGEGVGKKGSEVPLGATKVVLSRNNRDIRCREQDESEGETVTGVKAGLRGQAKMATKTVEEKKEMLGMWLGNVEQLVQGVEKVSFWGSIGGARKGR
ncbi:hypothetical protein I307_01806 [Cryptococcus deuterogattii 99/473]|uniref:Cell division control protein 14 n=1 Tax=Cryptococcus deuterogattii Ram5 TaxID=1296110 RepID=A0A0D0T0H3_9TREE|nr:hypothetical protein I313_05238 [Cryptococcus deuterogattii Ram5]KIY59002.1 hypothetical protein I307_01806 [Cryptococcus deuterogattii 99/473]